MRLGGDCRVPRTKADPSSIGKRIRELRLTRGLTLEQLAERVGLTWYQVGRIERGVSGVTVGRLPAFAKALGVPVTELFVETDGPKKVDVSPERFFRDQGLNEDQVRSIMRYAEFVREEAIRERAKGKDNEGSEEGPGEG